MQPTKFKTSADRIGRKTFQARTLIKPLEKNKKK